MMRRCLVDTSLTRLACYGRVSGVGGGGDHCSLFGHGGFVCCGGRSAVRNAAVSASLSSSLFSYNTTCTCTHNNRREHVRLYCHSAPPTAAAHKGGVAESKSDATSNGCGDAVAAQPLDYSYHGDSYLRDDDGTTSGTIPHSRQCNAPSYGCAPLIGIDPTLNPHTNMPLYLRELCYRSSYARERLREAIKEPSMEVALRELGDYTRLRRGGGASEDDTSTDVMTGGGEGAPAGNTTAGHHCYSPEELEALLAADDVGKIELLITHFSDWYYAMRAPEKVKMFEPWTWYPKARQMKRRFIFHVGPTNSGKTHAALERLTSAKSGVYCAPLKALAAQVWRRIDSKVPCDLLIGDERQFGGSAEHVSCTMEMTPTDYVVDVGVIDEIQMLSDGDRGWAWTRAVLGLAAKEIHLCGEERALGIVKALLRLTREDYSLTVVHHKRLVGLSLGPSLGGDYSRVENGDCIVAFGKNKIFEIKSEIERARPDAVVNVIYGGLPFAVRESESNAFNEGVAKAVRGGQQQQQQLDVSAASSSSVSPLLAKFSSLSSPPPPHILVTTDAIAYGLNMNIRRIVFSTMRMFNGRAMVDLPQSTVLQVGGRAGRFGMAFGAAVSTDSGITSSSSINTSSTGGRSSSSGGGGGGGLVTALYHRDVARIEAAFGSPLPMIQQCGLLPTADILTLFAELKYGSSSSVGNINSACSTNQKASREGEGGGGDGVRGAIANSHKNPSFSQLLSDFAASMEAVHGGGGGDNNGNADGSSSRRNVFFPCDMSRSVVAIAACLDGIGCGAEAEQKAAGGGGGASAAVVAAEGEVPPPSPPSSSTPPSPSPETIAAATPPHAAGDPRAVPIHALPFPIKDRIVFCFCPLSDNNSRFKEESYAVLRSYAVGHCRGVLVLQQLTPRSGVSAHQQHQQQQQQQQQLQQLGVRMVVDEALREIIANRPVGDVEMGLAATAATASTTTGTAEAFTSPPPSPSALSLATVYDDLARLEWIYRMVEVYGWLSWRFGTTFGGGGGGSCCGAMEALLTEEELIRRLFVGSGGGGGDGRHDVSPSPSASSSSSSSLLASSSASSPHQAYCHAIKDLCGSAIKARLAALPRSHVPPHVVQRQLEREAADAERGRYHHGNSTNGRTSNRSGHTNSRSTTNMNHSNSSSNAFIDFAPRPLVDMRSSSSSSPQPFVEGDSNGGGRRHHHHGDGQQQQQQQASNYHRQADSRRHRSNNDTNTNGGSSSARRGGDDRNYHHRVHSNGGRDGNRIRSNNNNDSNAPSSRRPNDDYQSADALDADSDVGFIRRHTNRNSAMGGGGSREYQQQPQHRQQRDWQQHQHQGGGDREEGHRRTDSRNGSRHTVGGGGSSNGVRGDDRRHYNRHHQGGGRGGGANSSNNSGNNRRGGPSSRRHSSSSSPQQHQQRPAGYDDSDY